MATPMYLVLAPVFAAPEIIPAGSIIRTHASPGDHLKPLNKEADDRMEEWYQEVHTYSETVYADDGTPQQRQRKFQPHLKFKMAGSGTQHVVHPVEVVKGPTRDQPGSLSLGETLVRHMQGDQRPGPAIPMKADLTGIELEGETMVVEAAPSPADKMRKT